MNGTRFSQIIQIFLLIYLLTLTCFNKSREFQVRHQGLQHVRIDVEEEEKEEIVSPPPSIISDDSIINQADFIQFKD
jgi:hypothetical protein